MLDFFQHEWRTVLSLHNIKQKSLKRKCIYSRLMWRILSFELSDIKLLFIARFLVFNLKQTILYFFLSLHKNVHFEL